MKVVVGTDKYRIPTEHAYAQAILALVQAYKSMPKAIQPPARNDVKQLWRVIREEHQELLTTIAKHSGIAQKGLETLLKTDWVGLRGIHNGLARICETQGIEKPIRVTGYNKHNRSYHMDPDVRATILNLSKPEH